MVQSRRRRLRHESLEASRWAASLWVFIF
ncbi:hypothetical protein HJG54_32655 [Leptolyngbya sp. NK1-12]|uniref:Uncharacterized protein n=1 Tax=Leptolyngbya sp. NK1-12 TaxID=2547451 RepID=A0AA96WMP3_9CYAN|nr:hypothetical protein [Elainella sp. C42_A2020_010]RNJ67254.1 MAG: hypothetical protein EDM05_21655 [Leptolyngbya sp. IPPAS B-1204]WNZ27999.1 hypothetical protein HJG54_32655 [Leptolyngbya sp. NK1-12]